MPTYRIVRKFQNHGDEYPDDEETRGLTLAEAQEWCRDPETSSSTATSNAARLVTEAKGPWFDAFEAEDEIDEDANVHTSTLSWEVDYPQVWHDGWRNADRTCRYKGNCVVCGTRTYAFDDGENDPRGVLGDHAASPMVAEDFDYTGDDVPCCFMCANDYDRYTRAVTIAKRGWTPNS